MGRKSREKRERREREKQFQWYALQPKPRPKMRHYHGGFLDGDDNQCHIIMPRRAQDAASPLLVPTSYPSLVRAVQRKYRKNICKWYGWGRYLWRKQRIP